MAKRTSTADLLAHTRELAKNLGPEFAEALEETLRVKNPEYKRGRALTIAEALELKPGAIVWMTYRKSPGDGLRVNEACTLHDIMDEDHGRYKRRRLGFEVGDFGVPIGEGPVTDRVCDQDFGIAFLYEAVLK